MSPSLPAQGAAAPWGDGLDTWLLVVHNADGTLKSAVAIPPGGPLTQNLAGGGYAITGLGVVTFTGLTGATTAFRFVGGTTSGAPIAGTFALGDAVVSQDGHLFVCITAGTPGSWRDVGTTTDALVSFTDITTNNASSTQHGFAPKSPADATKFLNGAATPAFAAVKDSDLATTDVTSNNASTSKHGFVPKLPNDASKYYDGTGAYSVPAGGGGISGGTVMPGSPTTNQLFQRTDLGLIFYYDGTRWLTINEYTFVGNIGQGAGNSTIAIFPTPSVLAMWLTRWEYTAYVLTTNDGSNFWTVALAKSTGAGVLTTIGSFTTAAFVHDTFTAGSANIGATVAQGSFPALEMTQTKTGGPGNCYPGVTAYYRLIGT